MKMAENPSMIEKAQVVEIICAFYYRNSLKCGILREN